MIPAYLNRINEAEYYYGYLDYEGDTDNWIIDGEPCVIEMAKRLFPGCSGRGRGKAKFKNSKRINGDINWLMQRFPLIIRSKEQWEKSYKETVKYVIKRDRIIANPEKVAPPISFKGDLREYQKEGLSFLLSNRRTLLADEMGLGKTPQVLSLLAKTEEYPAIIVVPSHLVTNWRREVCKFLDVPAPEGQTIDMLDGSRYIHVIQGLKPYDLPPASIYIIHYLLLRGWKDVLPKMGFKTVIFDEIQDLRHQKTEKYSAASLLAESAPNCFGLSGTPIYNRGGEIWNVLNIIEYHCLGDWDSFTREWCYGYGNDIVMKPEVLNDHLKREGLLLRRTKEMVLKELPAKRRVTQTIDFDSGKYGELIQDSIEKAKSIEFIKNVFDKGRLMREIVNNTRQALGIAKAPYVAAFVKYLLEAGEKILLFAHHHAVTNIYMEELKEFNPVRISGQESTKEKDTAVDKFMNGNTNIIVIALRAAAGLNLQRASCVVFGELDWSPAVHSQAEDRAHRYGQTDSVLCYYLVAEEGSDEEMLEHIGLKVSQFKGLMGDREETEEERLLASEAATLHMSRIVEKLRNKEIKKK